MKESIKIVNKKALLANLNEDLMACDCKDTSCNDCRDCFDFCPDVGCPDIFV